MYEKDRVALDNEIDKCDEYSDGVMTIIRLLENRIESIRAVPNAPPERKNVILLKNCPN